MGSEQKRMFLAFALSAGVLFIYQSYFAPKPVTNIVKEEKVIQGNTAQAPTKVVSPVVKTQAKQAPVVALNLESMTLTNGAQNVEILNNLTIQSMKTDTSVFKFNETIGEKEPLKIQLLNGSQPVDILFKFNRIDERTLEGINSEHGITFKASLQDNGKLSFTLNSATPYKYSIVFNSTSKSLENSQVRNFSWLDKDLETTEVGSSSNGEGKFKWVAVDFNFHLFALAFDKATLVRHRVLESGSFTTETIEATQSFNSNIVYTKKDFDHLKTLGNNLDLAIDFGFFGIIAVPILRGLQFFYKYFPNYGVAIILLTLVMRMLTFPLQYTSFKSMKKMQKIQPELAKLKEKFKDDPQRMQKETMGLFKKAGANPLGGCFPMLLQMPVFIAFYKVLYSSVELVEAPFYFWIHDLSIKDPYYVLPVIMGIVMMVQSKLNPSASADPMQKKLMLFMPIIFTVIMKDLPAGLNLYMSVSIALGVLQQLFVYKTTD